MKFSDCLARHPDTDKQAWHAYGIVYDILLNNYDGRDVNFLEIGVWSGGSTRSFEEFFGPGSTILALDLSLERVRHSYGPGVTLKEADAFAPATLAWLETCHAPFDIILDDSLHDYRSHEYLLRTFTRLLKPGGLMILEDATYPEAEMQALCREFGALYIRNQHNLGYARELNPRDYDSSNIIVKRV